MVTDEELIQLRADSEVLQLAIERGFLTNDDAAGLQLELRGTNATSGTKHPDVAVELVGHDGNAFAILGRVSAALRHAGYGAEVEEFTTEATAGDYDDLLATCMRWVEVS